METKLLLLCCIISFQCSAQNWQPIKEGAGVGNSSVFKLIEFNNKLFAGGPFRFIDSKLTSGIAYWNDANWIPYRSSDGFSSIRAFSVYQGELYGFASYPSSLTELIRMVKYNEQENSWMAVPGSEINPIDIEGELDGEYIADAIEYEDELYVIGRFNKIGGTEVKNIAKWDGSTWSPILENDSSVAPFREIREIVVFENELIIWGGIDSINGEVYNNIAKWNNSNWDNLNGGLLNRAFETWNSHSLEVFQGELYLGGGASSASENGTGYLLHKWNGSFWEGVVGFEQEDLDLFSSRITATTTFGDFLVLAKGRNSRTVLYNGKSILEIENEWNGAIYSFGILNKQLYAAGSFFGGDIPNGIARLGGLVKKDSNGGEVVCTVFPNPSSGTILLNYSLNNNSGVVIRIYDISGKFLMEEKFNDVKGTHLRSLDLSGLYKGSYMIQMISKEFEETKKLILR